MMQQKGRPSSILYAWYVSTSFFAGRKHRTELTNEQGKLDISKPYTQLCIRELMKEMFETFPQLDGLVIRTGETYLHDAPYYVGNHPVQMVCMIILR